MILPAADGKVELAEPPISTPIRKRTRRSAEVIEAQELRHRRLKKEGYGEGRPQWIDSIPGRVKK